MENDLAEISGSVFVPAFPARSRIARPLGRVYRTIPCLVKSHVSAHLSYFTRGELVARLPAFAQPRRDKRRVISKVRRPLEIHPDYGACRRDYLAHVKDSSGAPQHPRGGCPSWAAYIADFFYMILQATPFMELPRLTDGALVGAAGA